MTWRLKEVKHVKHLSSNHYRLVTLIVFIFSDQKKKNETASKEASWVILCHSSVCGQCFFFFSFSCSSFSSWKKIISRSQLTFCIVLKIYFQADDTWNQKILCSWQLTESGSRTWDVQSVHRICVWPPIPLPAAAPSTPLLKTKAPFFFCSDAPQMYFESVSSPPPISLPPSWSKPLSLSNLEFCSFVFSLDWLTLASLWHNFQSNQHDPLTITLGPSFSYLERFQCPLCGASEWNRRLKVIRLLPTSLHLGISCCSLQSHFPPLLIK